MTFGKDVVFVEWSFEGAHKRGFRWRRCNRRGCEVAGLRGLRIRPRQSADHRSPYLFRRDDTTQTDFIATASGAAESSDIVVRVTHLSRGADRGVIRARRS
jgi:hypothetical protein